MHSYLKVYAFLMFFKLFILIIILIFHSDKNILFNLNINKYFKNLETFLCSSLLCYTKFKFRYISEVDIF